MSSNKNDAAINAMSPRQITDVLITLLEHAEHNKLARLETSLGGCLEALMEDLQNKERTPSQSQGGCTVVDFNEARHRLLLDGRGAAPMRETGPTRTTWT